MVQDRLYSTAMSQSLATLWILVLFAGQVGAQAAPRVVKPQAQRSVMDDLVIARGTMAAGEKRRQFPITLSSGPVGWEIVLQSSNPMTADLDLYVYDAGRKGDRSRPLCSSESSSELETCRLVPVPQGPLTIDVVLNGGGGATGFVLTRRRLRGPRMGETPAVADDAQPIPRGAWMNKEFQGAEKILNFSSAGFPFSQLFVVAPEGSAMVPSWTAVLSAADPAASLVLRIFSEEGKELTSPAGRGPYQDFVVPGGQAGAQRYYLLVASTVSRTPSSFGIGLFPGDHPIPNRGGINEWIASGTGNRSYAIRVDDSETAIVKLEGIRVSMSVGDSGGHATPITSLFGAAQQVAWIGDPVGSSRHLLTGIAGGRLLLLKVKLADSAIYKNSGGWALHVHGSRTQPNYLIRLDPEEGRNWGSWWATSVAMRDDTLGSSGIRLIALQSPPEVDPSMAVQQIPNRRATAPPPVFLARIESGGGFHLAVCTADGRVLDIGGAGTIRWEWSPGLGQLYIAVFPNPQDPDQRGGPFRLELTRSLIERQKSP